MLFANVQNAGKSTKKNRSKIVNIGCRIREKASPRPLFFTRGGRPGGTKPQDVLLWPIKAWIPGWRVFGSPDTNIFELD